MSDRMVRWSAGQTILSMRVTMATSTDGIPAADGASTTTATGIRYDRGKAKNRAKPSENRITPLVMSLVAATSILVGIAIVKYLGSANMKLWQPETSPDNSTSEITQRPDPSRTDVRDPGAGAKDALQKVTFEPTRPSEASAPQRVPGAWSGFQMESFRWEPRIRRVWMTSG